MEPTTVGYWAVKSIIYYTTKLRWHVKEHKQQRFLVCMNDYSRVWTTRKTRIKSISNLAWAQVCKYRSSANPALVCSQFICGDNLGADADIVLRVVLQCKVRNTSLFTKIAKGLVVWRLCKNVFSYSKNLCALTWQRIHHERLSPLCVYWRSFSCR